MDDNTKVLETCRAMGRYFKSKGVEYNGHLSAYAEDNGYDDDDSFAEELLETEFDEWSTNMALSEN